MRKSVVLAMALLSVLAATTVLGLPANRWESFGEDVRIANGSVLDTAQAIALDPGDPRIVYAGYNRGVYKTTDDGVTWELVFQDRAGGPTLPFARPIVALSLDRGDPSTVFAVTTDSIQRTRNAGFTWQPVLVSEGVSAISPLLAGADVYASARNNASHARASLRSSDRGETWTPMPDLAGKLVRAFAVDAGHPQTVWAAVSQDPDGSAVYRTTDGGTTWTARGGIPSSLVNDLIVDSESGFVYVATADAGIFKSVNSGGSWEAVNDGLPHAAIEHLAVGSGSALYAQTFLEGVLRSTDGGAHWIPAGFRGYRVGSIFADSSSPTLYAGILGALMRIDLPPALTCENGAESLCLNDGRFRVELSWRTRDRETHVGRAVPLTDDTGYFWFLGPDNVEIALKVLDGSSTNGYFWVFFGALSSLEYTITVTDIATSAIQSYWNFASELTSVADTSAFAATAPVAPVLSRRRELPRPALADACAPGPNALCLNGGRFRAEMTFQKSPAGPTQTAPAVPLTNDTGYFWFFDDANVEIVVKVLDGRAINGHFWVFYGAMSTVGYTIVVTDTETGEQRAYTNEPGNLASVADTSAF